MDILLFVWIIMRCLIYYMYYMHILKNPEEYNLICINDAYQYIFILELWSEMCKSVFISDNYVTLIERNQLPSLHCLVSYIICCFVNRIDKNSEVEMCSYVCISQPREPWMNVLFYCREVILRRFLKICYN